MHRRGRLRVYLGAAPGVGKTFAMLDEGQRRSERGTDVVIGLVETHDRPKTAAQIGDLEIVPRRVIEHRGARFTEMDLGAVLARAPQVALVDELAHTNVPGSRNVKRHQDVAELLAAGIDVITTVNVQHLESLNDVVQRITGVRQQETVPDAVVRAADQIELVDMSPQALRRRMAHGNVYAAEKMDAALANYFRIGNLTALRELALLWLADRVDEGLQEYRAAHGIHETWEARERVVVALPGGPQGEVLIRRGARIAARTGSGLLAVHVVSSDGLSRSGSACLAGQRHLVESLGGTFHEVLGDDVATAILEVARAENATQIVLGATTHSRLYSLINGSTNHDVVRLSGPIDVHVVTHPHAADRGWKLPGLSSGLSLRRQLAGLGAAAAGLPLLTLALHAAGRVLNLASDLLAFLLFTLVVALIGGLWPALLAAVAAFVLLNYFFTPPLYTFTIADPNNLIALLVFVAAAGGASAVVDLVARRARQAAAAIPAMEADRMRSALLAAVSHDLRTPLAGAKVAVSTLRQQGLNLSEDDRRELFDAAETSLDRLTCLVADLLDMSRLQAGVIAVFPRRIALDELVPLVLDRLDVSPGAVVLEVPDTLPEVSTDPVLLERVLANLVSNAARYSPPGRPPAITGSVPDLPGPGARIELRVIDHGPGIPETDRELAFVPFQRLGDRDNTTGVGLGLAVARGLTEVLGGTLEPEQTPGGGLTMVISLPLGPVVTGAAAREQAKEVSP